MTSQRPGQHNSPPDARLEAQQTENVRLLVALQQRRGAAARPIQYLLDKLPGDAFNYPERQAAAEVAWLADPLPDGFSTRDALEWAKRHAGG